jgi:hypothetical protein
METEPITIAKVAAGARNCKGGSYCHVIKILENLITEYRIKLVVLGKQKKLHEINSSNYKTF